MTRGGAEVQLKNIIKFHDRKSEIIVISLISKKEIGVEIESLGINVYSLNLKNIFHLPAGLIKFIYLFIKFKPDIVHSWMYHSNLFSSFFCKLFRVKNIIWSIHQYDTSRKFNSYLTLFVIKLGAYLSSIVPDKIICVSEEVKLSHVKFGYCEKKILVISNGIDTNLFTFNNKNRFNIRKELKIDYDSFLIGFFARFHPIKGHFNFLNSIKLLEQSNINNSFTILLVGLNCDVNNLSLMSEIKKLNLKSRIILLGQRSDIHNLFSALDLFVSASENEAFSISLAEALSSGIISVSTKQGDPSNLLSTYGFHCSDNSPMNLYNSITEALMNSKNKAEWNLRKTEASEFIKLNYDIRTILINYKNTWYSK